MRNSTGSFSSANHISIRKTADQSAPRFDLLATGTNEQYECFEWRERAAKKKKTEEIGEKQKAMAQKETGFVCFRVMNTSLLMIVPEPPQGSRHKIIKKRKEKCHMSLRVSGVRTLNSSAAHNVPFVAIAEFPRVLHEENHTALSAL